MMSEQGCSDGNCKLRIEPLVGQHTNGGCRCLQDVPNPLRRQIERKLWMLKAAMDGHAMLNRRYGDALRVIRDRPFGKDIDPAAVARTVLEEDSPREVNDE
jgi:hypothetical protein